MIRKAHEIREIFKENKITGYRLAQDLDVTQVGADKFLNGETQNPYKSTLEMYNSYIDNNFQPKRVLHNEYKGQHVENTEEQIQTLLEEKKSILEEYETDDDANLTRIELEYLANKDKLEKRPMLKGDFITRFIMHYEYINKKYGSYHEWIKQL